MEYGKWLIDKALEVCEPHTRYELWKRTGLAESHLSAVYNGKKPLSTTMARKLAQVAGLDADQAVLRALAERARGKSLEGMAAAIGGVGTLLFSYSSSVWQDSPNLTIATAMFDWLRIVSNCLNSLFIRARSDRVVVRPLRHA